MNSIVHFTENLCKALIEKISYSDIPLWQKKMSEHCKQTQFKHPKEKFAHRYLTDLNIHQARYLSTLEHRHHYEENFFHLIRNPLTKKSLAAIQPAWQKALAVLPANPANFHWSTAAWEKRNFFHYASKQPTAYDWAQRFSHLQKIYPAPNKVSFRWGKALWKKKKFKNHQNIVCHVAFLLLPMDDFLWCMQHLSSIWLASIQTKIEPIYRTLLQSRPGETPAAGNFQNLQPIAEKIHRQWFAHIEPDKITVQWGEKFSCRTLGSYEFLTGRVRISLIFDAMNVKHELLEYLLFHEILHQWLGFRAQKKRIFAHTHEFRKIESAYPDQKKIEQQLYQYAHALW